MKHKKSVSVSVAMSSKTYRHRNALVIKKNSYSGTLFYGHLFGHGRIMIRIAPFEKPHKEITGSNNKCHHCINNKWVHRIHFFPFFCLLSFRSLLYITANPAISNTKENMATRYMIIGSRISANIVESKSAVTIYLAISNSHFPNSFFIAAKIVSFQETTKYFMVIFIIAARTAPENDKQICVSM